MKIKLNKYFTSLLAILGLSFGIYQTFIRDYKPEIVFDVLSNNDVLSINEDVNDLKILYNDKDLKEQNKKLVLLNVKIENIGNGDVKEGDYYSKTPFGIEIENGEMIKVPSIINSSNNFLHKNTKVSLLDSNKIILTKIPLGKNEFFTLEILTIVKKEATPKVIAIGYISGSNGEIKVIESYKSIKKSENIKSWYESMFYYIGIVLTIIIVILIISTTLDSHRWQRPIDKSFRDDVVERAKSKNIKEFQSELFDHLYEKYLKYGDNYLFYINHYMFNNESKLKIILNRIDDEKPISDLLDFKNGEDEDLIIFIKYLLKNDILSNLENGIKISLKGRNDIDDFEGLIRRTGDELLEK